MLPDFYFSDDFALLDSLPFDIARSSQINARIGVDPNRQCIARRLQAISLNHYRKSGFCYHLYYQRIIRTHETHTARLSRMMMGIVTTTMLSSISLLKLHCYAASITKHYYDK